MKLHELFDLSDLEKAVADKLVKRQVGPHGLAILNYTPMCVYEKAWTPVTRQCRGLIYDVATQDVVARPFPKFFNFGEQEAGPLDLSAPVQVTDKADGSLGVLYPLPPSEKGAGGHAIATRGSFTSEQAVHATEVWRSRYAHLAPDPGITLLFEIVYPQNRIVLDYGDLDDLLFLTAIDNRSGLALDSYEWPGRRVEHFSYGTLAEALTAEPRPNAEGLVVYFPGTGERVKIKQDDYKFLHGLLTGLNPRLIWERLAVQNCKGLIKHTKDWQRLGLDPARAEALLKQDDTEGWLASLIDSVPDEFYAWVQDQIAKLTQAASDMDAEFRELAAKFKSEFPIRKDYAAAVSKCGHPHFPALFLLYDGGDITTYIWKNLYPADVRTWFKVSEDVA